MIKPSSIQYLYDNASVKDIVSSYVDLKKKGVNWQGCCPFHDEKSASFMVNEPKNMYKCFGCGAGGSSPMKFVQEIDKVGFVDACHTVAKLINYTLEYEEKEYTAEQKKALTAAQAQEEVLNYVVPLYQGMLHCLAEEHPAKQWVRKRGLSDDDCAALNIGWGGEDYHFITPLIINKEMFEPASKLKIISKHREGDGYFDFYRSRITIPISDKDGRFIGLAGAWVLADEKDKDFEAVKYINPADCEIYHKSKTLFGLHRAAKSIKEKGFIYLVEGYMDCISPSRYGIGNIAALCGTALTEGHISLLKRYTNYIVLWLDYDKAGQAATEKHLPDLIKAGFKIGVANYAEGEGCKDPDEWTLAQKEEGKIPEVTDGVNWYAERVFEMTEDDAYKVSVAKKKMFDLFLSIEDMTIRNHYVQAIVKKFKWKAGIINTELKNHQDAASAHYNDDEDNLSSVFPTWVTEEQKLLHMKQGYLRLEEEKNKKGIPRFGYYTFSQNGTTEITNFSIEPLFMIDGGQEETRYLVQIKNGHIDDVLDVPAKAMVGIDMFQGVAVNRGNFVIHGNKQQWLRIASDLLQQFPRCTEVRELGWQRRGAFCYVDKVFIPGQGLSEPDDWGIFKMDDINMLIPASSQAYKKLENSGVDPFENDRYLNYKKADISFEDWAEKMKRVYGQKGVTGVAYAILTLFRDLVFEIDNNCPHLYAFGEPSSGKSKWVESITAIFYFKRAAFNLNSGTDFAFSAYMRRFVNCPAHLNEFDIEVIKPEWFQQIKGVYDGESRERGKIGSRHATEIMKVLGTLILTGQKLVTADDNSVVSRSLIEPFDIAQSRTDADIKAYDDLKLLEGQGLNSILTDVLEHRIWFKENYRLNMNNLLSYWRREKADARTINQRILQNWGHLAVCYGMISEKLKLPQSHTDFTEHCYQSAKKWNGFIKNTDTLSDFWNAVEIMANSGRLLEGWDFIISSETTIRVRLNREDEKVVELGGSKKILFIRLKDVHQAFAMDHKRLSGKEAMNLANILHYFSSRAYFLGPVKEKIFTKYIYIDKEKMTEPEGGHDAGRPVIRGEKEKVQQRTSCYAFYYEELPIQIERQNPGDNELPI